MSELFLNGRAPAKKGKDLCTRDEAAEMAQKAAMLVTEHLAQQIPALVGTIVEAALRAYDESVRGAPISLNDVILAPPPDGPITRDEKALIDLEYPENPS